MFTAALFTIAKTWKQPNCPSTDAQMKIWYIRTMEYYSAMLKNETLSFAIMWVDLEAIMLSEISQRKTDTV